MIQRVLSHYSLTSLTDAGLILFFSVFIGALIWTLRKKNSNLYKYLEQLPLEELKPNIKEGP
jgi:cbb3-type cytochrome oxidase subunit 3